MSGSSRDPTGGETAAQSRKKQSVDVGGVLLQLVHLGSEISYRSGGSSYTRSRSRALLLARSESIVTRLRLFAAVNSLWA
jgi:hypothetical protein